MIYLRINLKLKLLIFPIFQKPYYRNFSFMAGFVDALRPEKFSGEHFKRWQTRVILWLSAMNVLWVSKGKPDGILTPDQEKAFTEANTLFVGAVIGTLVDRLQDVYLHHTDAKKLWDALEADYGGTDQPTRQVCGWWHHCQVASFLEGFCHYTQTQEDGDISV
jgi:hypothetical protein